MEKKKNEQTVELLTSEKPKNYFEQLFGINVNDKVEKKNNLSYLSWAFAWGELKKRHPDATYFIYENAQGWAYHTDGRTAWVKTGVTVNGIEHIEYLPVMDYKNKSIPANQVTSFDVNKAIQRSLTKAVARHGLGLYIYAGEDLPESDDKEKERAEDRKALAEESQVQGNLDATIDAKELARLNAALNEAQAAWALETFKVADLSQLTKRQYAQIFDALNRKKANGNKGKTA